MNNIVNRVTVLLLQKIRACITASPFFMFVKSYWSFCCRIFARKFWYLDYLRYLCRLKHISMATRLFDIEQDSCMQTIGIGSSLNSLMKPSGGGRFHQNPLSEVDLHAVAGACGSQVGTWSPQG